LNGVSVRVVGIRLGLQFSKTDDKHGSANGDFFKGNLRLKNSQERGFRRF
jgi:hypothetical protein